MPTIAEIRLRRLRELRDQYGTMANLLRALGRSTRDATLSQILNQSPDASSANKKPRTMGTELARAIEAKLELPTGWMDAINAPGSHSAREPSAPPYRSGWPFTFDRKRFDALSKSDRDRVEGAALAIIIECEGTKGRARGGRARHIKRSA